MQRMSATRHTGPPGLLLLCAIGLTGCDVIPGLSPVPPVNVRIINETQSPARVGISAVARQSGLADLLQSISSAFIPLANRLADTGGLIFAGSVVRDVAAGETVMTTAPCGARITLSAVSPPLENPLLDELHYDPTMLVFGFTGVQRSPDGTSFPEGVLFGNIVLEGVGAGQTSEFGDAGAVTLQREIRPQEDGLDCAAGTLVIRIQTTGSGATIDPQTGGIVDPGLPGRGRVEIE